MQDNTPIVLCHAACSGGSVIFRTLAQRFGLCGISEIGHMLRSGNNAFHPMDPEYLFYLNGEMDEKELEALYAERVRNCFRRASDKKRRLLLREHTHSYFFLARNKTRYDAGFSWLMNHANGLFGESCPALVSFRDPVDSWLGLCASFPHLAQYSFDEYCARYNYWLDLMDEYEANHVGAVLRFKYEDLIDDVDSTLEEIASFLGTPVGVATESTTVVSTGNSGRSTKTLSRRPRRKYSIGFLKAAENSEQYGRLCQRLVYPHCLESTTALSRLNARLNSVTKFFMHRLKSAFTKAKSAGKKAMVAD